MTVGTGVWRERASMTYGEVDMSYQRVKFYQTGTFTVGNRLLDESDRTVQAGMDRTNSLNSGHRACQGCGEEYGARNALDSE